MKIIWLTQGQFTMVDDEDYIALIKYKWATRNEDGYIYAVNRIGKGSISKDHDIRMHRYLMGLEFGNPLQVDHKNHITLDNRRENLRVVTIRQNAMNKVSRGNSSSKYLGVSFMTQRYKSTSGIVNCYTKWEAYIKVDGKKKSLGVYKTEEQAAIARDAASVKYYGEFANLNFP